MGSSSTGTEQIAYSVDKKKTHASEDLGVWASIGVFYRCPQLGPELLPKGEWTEKVDSHILKQMENNRVVGICLTMQTYNSEESVTVCVELLCTYLNNILENPKNEKYKTISITNKTFSEKVKTVKGALGFLDVAGFKLKNVKTARSVIECLVLEGNVDATYFEHLIKTLRTVQPIKLHLDRNVSVLKANQTKKLDVPDDFFKLTVEEVQSEQKKKSESIKAASKLMTKAMREMEEEKTKKQGTFKAEELLMEVRQFVSECLAAQVPFELVSSLGNTFSQYDYQTTIQNLNLVPAAVLNIHIKPPVKILLIREDLVKKMKNL